MKRNSILAVLLSLLVAPSAWAATSFSSAHNQTFDQRQGAEQLSDITVVEDSQNPVIKKGYLEVSIPKNFPMIFDDTRTSAEILIYGDAVDEGKIAEKPEVTFTNEDMTVRIPILADLSVNDSFVITRLFVEGFYSQPLNSSPLEFKLNGESPIYYDPMVLYVRTSSNSDTRAPEMPQGVSLKNTAEGIQVTWEDPTDQDVQAIELYRDTRPDVSITSTPYAQFARGIEEFLDDDVQAGQTYYYILRASDGRNLSLVSAEVSIQATLQDAQEETPPADEPETPTEDQPVDETPEAPAEDEPTNETPTPFTDLATHWAQTAVEALHALGVITGNPDGTYQPNANLNRAEAAALIQRLLQAHESTDIELSQPATAPFSDTSVGAWFTPYVHDLKTRELVTGNPDGTYQPNESINRAEFLTLALRAFEAMGGTAGTDVETFSDVQTGAWYQEAVAQAQAEALIEGVACGTARCFEPNREISRAEAAQILHKIWLKVEAL